MMSLIFLLVSLLASCIGSICGIGGGVIIKPVLDMTHIMSVSCISFLSGCTVLTTAVVSLYKNTKAGRKLNVRIATLLAIGAVVGGITGKMMFQALKTASGNENLVGFVQSIVMIIITGGTFIYTLYKAKIKTHAFQNAVLCVIIGLLLGIMSSFLGIGGGPINLVILSFFFSLASKDSAMASLYIIMFSQIASLVQTIATGTVPDVSMFYLVIMVAGGISGGIIGSRINKKIDDRTVDKLFMGLMVVIIFINIYNTWKFACLM